jgi:hypothetical protein
MLVLEGAHVHCRGSLFWHKLMISPRNLPCVMLTFVTIHLYPTWKRHSNTCKNEIESPLWYLYLSNHVSIWHVVVYFCGCFYIKNTWFHTSTFCLSLDFSSKPQVIQRRLFKLDYWCHIPKKALGQITCLNRWATFCLCFHTILV